MSRCRSFSLWNLPEMQQSERKTDRQKVQAMQAEEKSRPRMHKPEKVILLLSSFLFLLWPLSSGFFFGLYCLGFVSAAQEAPEVPETVSCSIAQSAFRVFASSISSIWLSVDSPIHSSGFTFRFLLSVRGSFHKNFSGLTSFSSCLQSSKTA